MQIGVLISSWPQSSVLSIFSLILKVMDFYFTTQICVETPLHSGRNWERDARMEDGQKDRSSDSVVTTFNRLVKSVCNFLPHFPHNNPHPQL